MTTKTIIAFIAVAFLVGLVLYACLQVCSEQTKEDRIRRAMEEMAAARRRDGVNFFILTDVDSYWNCSFNSHIEDVVNFHEQTEDKK